jgi:hypothetical protein
MELNLKSSIFHKPGVFTCEKDFVEFNRKKFKKSEIKDIRYGIKPINGYRFRIGRIYYVDIRNSEGEIIKIRLRSLYRINRISLWNKYKIILESLFDNHINDISLHYISKFNEGLSFNLLGNTISREGILFQNDNDIIPWMDLGTKNYATYFSLFSLSNGNHYKTFQYLTDWNTVVLFSVTRHILATGKFL